MDSKFMLFLGRAVLVVGLIAGIVAGFYGAFSPYGDGFRWGVALTCWSSAIVSSFILFGLSASLENQEEILFHLKSIRFPQSEVPLGKLGNSKMKKLDALGDYKMDSKE